ncbi:ABC transporter, ATP-binding protein [Ancylostoma caninum]|uniref:ABC transporter, ATP-binding protein n=2 Tax=Ancylostoma caninum TaxID=29170 RepID=A0A368G7F7_ANCCA|nr:ABC transporter, ATP-binding protein [Ancylostoma caninum]
MSRKGPLQKNEETDKPLRIAIVEKDRCKPKNCGLLCKRSCPVVKMGKQCIVVETSSTIAEISEVLCIGCGICVKKCPYDAIKIINLPSNLANETTHRYSANSFKLHRLPTPRTGEKVLIVDGFVIPEFFQVLGLVGTNGIGKSTALKVLAGKLKPNLGKYDAPPDWPSILQYFRGSELQNYFTKILEDNLKAVVKPQYVDQIPRAAKGTVESLLSRKADKGNREQVQKDMELDGLLQRQIEQLSGGELQRFAIAMCCIQKADVYMFDEPSSYLDVKQRLRAASLIRDMIAATTLCLILSKNLGSFKLNVEAGDFSDSEIIVMLGENGTGKTTMIRMLAGSLKPDEEVEMPNMTVSYKPQKISPKYENIVRHMLHEKIPNMYMHPQFKSDVMNPLMMDQLMDREVQTLSGGELQRVALVLCLGKTASVYLIDEPSAYLDSEQRLHAAKVIKRFIMHAKKTAFVVEHDFIMATYLADRVIVFDGEPSVQATARRPQNLQEGMNRFLKMLEITFRRDTESYRPRINKKDSIKDIEQKKSGQFFFLDEA